jgi:hypothetical protein
MKIEKDICKSRLKVFGELFYGHKKFKRSREDAGCTYR